MLAALWAAAVLPDFGRAETAGTTSSPGYSASRPLVYPLVARAPKDQPLGGDFELEVVPAAQAVCQGDDVVYAVIVAALGGFSGEVALDLTGAPAGVTVAFDPASAPAPYTSTLTIGDTAGAAPGDYDLQVTGVSATSTHTTTAGLTVAAAPGIVELIAPAYGLRDVTPLPTFEWAADPAAAIYTLDIARDVAFANIYITASGLSQTDYTLDTPLRPGLYYWRVRGENDCGPSAAWQTFRFFVGRQDYLPLVAKSG